MVWLKIIIFVISTIVLTTCLVIVNTVNSVVPSVINNGSTSKLDNSQILTSVHDAMKYNHKIQLSDEVTDLNLGRIGPPLLIAMDNRNKRNTNNVERSDYYFTNPQDSYTSNIRHGDSEYEHFISKSNLMCQNQPLAKENEYTISITQGMSSISSLAFTIGKIIFGLIAVLLLPVIILKALLFPIKLLLGIKAFTVVKSVLFSALAWRFLRKLNLQNSDDTQDDEDIDEGISLPSLSNVNQINSDFGEINVHDVKRILRYVKEKDKDW